MSRYFSGRTVAFYEEKPDLDLPNVELRDWFSIPGAKRFLDRVRMVYGADGLNHRDPYDFRFDCSKFCRKVFAQDAVFEEDEYVFWVDADTVVKREVDPEELIRLFGGKALLYMGRAQTYTETGFVGFHTKHPDFQRFRDSYLKFLTSGAIFSQKEGWHDCIVFDKARKGIAGQNLTPHGHGFNPVIQDTPLGKYFDHLKGNRKTEKEPKNKNGPAAHSHAR